MSKKEKKQREKKPTAFERALEKAMEKTLCQVARMVQGKNIDKGEKVDDDYAVHDGMDGNGNVSDESVPEGH